MNPLNWKSIRILNGSQEKAFEELCTQLAREDRPLDAGFERKGTPDAGVECYATLGNGDEWGWQSKYVFTMGAAQWSELDKSVKSALTGHPRLVRYYVCLPMDLPDGRVGKSRSARDHWNTHVTKWQGWAAAQGMSVEFVLWDSSTMLHHLAEPKHRGRVVFWFGSPGCFDGAWYESHVQAAIKSAGPRYTPELHVDVPLARSFEAFGRTSEMVKLIHSTARPIQESFKHRFGWTDCDETPGLGTSSALFKEHLNRLLHELDNFVERPFGSQGINLLYYLAQLALGAIDDVEARLDVLESSARALPNEPDEAYKLRHERLQRIEGKRSTLRDTSNALWKAKQTYQDVQNYADAQSLVVSGEAGTGKTHLFCDIAKHRLLVGRPTLLLLGQSFTSTDHPTRQMLAQLDLPHSSMEELVGCLEASAQAAGSRCLVLVDAVNEGVGRDIWPSHLTSFIESFIKSPWIAIAVSVRTCYLEGVIPPAVLASAAKAHHEGFAQVQYEAAKTFFLYHGLEFASAPVFSAEFSNPLFLKTLCRGLHASGYNRLPRGFHGITKVFELYVSALEKVLSARLDYPPQSQLVRNSLESFSKAMAKQKVRWLTLEDGRRVVDEHLRGRDFSKSLYKALVDEGLLMEGITYSSDGVSCDTVCVAYERWADHLAASILLDEHMDTSDPAAAFRLGAPLAVFGDGYYMPAGLKEAFCIQVPERIGREFLSLAPYALHEWGMEAAFLNSIVWRSPEACTPAMRALLDFYEIKGVSRDADVWETRLTVLTIPGHTLNMEQMDRRLKSMPMNERDAEWSVEIHMAWDREGVINRLVDWAWSVKRGSTLDDEAVWLASMSLCWCFTSSNRFLRDRATKAAVNLLDGRLDQTIRLVRHFAGIDDLYVWERVLAVACGVAMRSMVSCKVGDLAEAVHEAVFGSGSPPAHILLRDYARGIIERAIHFGSTLSFDPNIARPPYKSVWPTIPSEPEIEALKTDWQRIGKDNPDEEWARHSIINSVLDNDFGRYVIGTNSWSTDWLSLRLDEPEWKSVDERIEELVKTFSRRQRAAWGRFEAGWKFRMWDVGLRLISSDIRSKEEDAVMIKSRTDSDRRFAALKDRLLALFSPEQRVLLEHLVAEKEKPLSDYPPKFDLRLIQRYVVKRVFDLGWSVELFGWFDRKYVTGDGRSAQKAERIGKKYQWIAYHEISALVTDHFQYHERHGSSETPQRYVGPWQDWFRDIDPTHGIKCRHELATQAPEITPWWMPRAYENWESDRPGDDWSLDATDFPDPAKFFRVTDRTGVSWLNLYGVLVWERKRRPSEGYDDAEQRKIFFKFQAYLIKNEDVSAVLQWAKGQDVGEHWMSHDLPHGTRVFLGEHAWSSAAKFFENYYYGDDGWNEPGDGCSVKVRLIPAAYLEESAGFDCSMDEGFRLTMPCGEIVRDWGLRWSGVGSDFVDNQGQVVAMDPAAHEHGEDSLLVREDAFTRYLEQRAYTVVWAVTAEKEYFGSGHTPKDFNWLRFSGAYALNEGAIHGSIRHEKGKRG